jgi:hypothetical protein
MMTGVRHRWLLSALIVAAATAMPGHPTDAANKPPKPAAMLGSHPSKDAQTARTSVLKQRSSTVPFKSNHVAKTTNSLIRRPGKTITVARKLPR